MSKTICDESVIPRVGSYRNQSRARATGRNGPEPLACRRRWLYAKGTSTKGIPEFCSGSRLIWPDSDGMADFAGQRKNPADPV